MKVSFLIQSLVVVLHQSTLLVTVVALWSNVTIVGADDWTEFRGPTGQGHSTAKNLPPTWSKTDNVAWKTQVPGRGWSSPVIANGQIWLTTADNDGTSLRALCYSAKTGKLIHNIEVIGDNRPKRIHDKNSHASPTPILEGNRVYVHFGTYGTACLENDGSVVWKKKLNYEPRHGPGGSPVLHRDLLILNCDGTDVQYVVALDKNNGKVRWKTPRAHASAARLNGTKMAPMAFSTPLIVQHNGTTQVVSAGGDHVAGYDVDSGSEIWWSAYDGYSVVPRPVAAKGFVFASSCYDGPVFYAIRLGGIGNVTESHVAWTLKRGAPHNPSPIAVGDEIYVINDAGIATCLDIESGKKHWQKRLGGNFSASPLQADGRIYFTDEDGTTTVVEPGTKYKAIAKNKVDERTLASLAAVDRAIFMRTESNLYRFQKP